MQYWQATLVGGATFRALTAEDLPNIDVLTSVDSNKIVFTKEYSYTSLGLSPSSNTHIFLQAYLKQLLIDYPGLYNVLFISRASPDSVGYCWVYFYDTIHIINDLPKYCFGQFAKLETTCDINVYFNVMDGVYTYKKMTYDDPYWTEWE